MQKLRRNVAGIDIGAKQIFVAVEGQSVRIFDTYTEDFLGAAEYLLENKIKTVAMEATGVYWIILFEVLEKAGFDVWLVDGRQTRQVPGRKTDIKDCQWIQQLHGHGLLNKCFVPEAEVKEIRNYQRIREDHIRSCSMHVNHMQKALVEMNIRLKETISQIHGTSGLAIIEAILKGERDPHKLLSLCHTKIRKKKAVEVLKALNGHYTEQGLFALGQAYKAFFFYKDQIRECDKAVERCMERMNTLSDHHPENKQGVGKAKRKPIRHNKPEINNLSDHLLKIFTGKDATVLPGITDYTWLQLYGETGNNLSKWPTEKHYTSWLGLAPGQHQSGKTNKTRNKKAHPKAGQIFRLIAQSLIESKTIGLGAFGRRLKSKRGPGIATKATARKLAILYWRLMVKGLEYTERGIVAYEEKMKLNKERYLQKAAKEFGYQLTVTKEYE